jgi:hypothetical protein
MCEWVSTNEMRDHISRIRGCPGCRCRIDTLDHILQHHNTEAVETRQRVMAEFMKDGKKTKAPQRVTNRMHDFLNHYMNAREGPLATPGDAALGNDTGQQQPIDKLAPRRVLAKGWTNVMEQDGTNKPEHKMIHLEHMLWILVMETVWIQTQARTRKQGRVTGRR